MGHARAVATAPDPEALTREIVAKGLSVRQAEAARQARASPAPAATSAEPARATRKPVDADLAALERQLGDMLGLKVKVAHKGAGRHGDAALFEPRPARHDLPAAVAASRSSASALRACAGDREQFLAQRFAVGGAALNISCALELAGALGDRRQIRPRPTCDSMLLDQRLYPSRTRPCRVTP